MGVYHIFACPSPAVPACGPLDHIGDVITVPEFIESALERRLRFRHQLKEEDYSVRPEWKSQLGAEHVHFAWEHFGSLPDRVVGSWLPCTQWDEPRRTHDTQCSDPAASSSIGLVKRDLATNSFGSLAWWLSVVHLASLGII